MFFEICTSTWYVVISLSWVASGVVGLFQTEKRQLRVRPIEWSKLNFASCVVHTCFVHDTAVYVN